MKIHNLNEINEEYNQDQTDSIRSDREKLILNFPYSVLITADYEEINTAKKWCWENFGEVHIDKCDEYSKDSPICPIAIKAHQLRKEQPIYDMDTVVIDGVSVTNHSHTGKWSTLWYGKIDYDYGYIEFFFKKEEDRSKFESTVESLITEYPSGVKGRTIDGVDVSE